MRFSPGLQQKLRTGSMFCQVHASAEHEMYSVKGSFLPSNTTVIGGSFVVSVTEYRKKKEKTTQK